jgi:DNA-binding NarL/FixJ family response regulator
MSVRLLIADGHRVVLHGLTAMLGQLAAIKIIASCSDGIDALRKIKTLAPDVALVDVNMPRLGGLDVLASVKSEKLPTRIVLLSDNFNDWVLRSAITNGVFGLLLKDASTDDYVACITRVSKGSKWRSPKLRRRLFASGNSVSRPVRIIDLPMLTTRECQVADLVKLGKTNREIAKALRLSEGTVKIHLYNMYRKAGVHNRTALAEKIASAEQ